MSEELRPITARRWRPKLALVALLHILTFTYFWQGAGWNQVANVSEVRVFVERGHFTLDEFGPLTGDGVEFHGQTFSNKTPALTFFAAPPYFVCYQVARWAGVDVTSDGYQRFASIAVTFFCAGMWGVLLGQLLFWLLGELFPGLTGNDRLFFAAMAPLATMIFPYATLGTNNLFESFWVGLTLYRALRYVQRGATPKRAALLGAAYGVVVLVNPTMLVMSPVFAWLLLRNGRLGVATFAVAFAACMTPWLVYNAVNFGNVLTTNRGLLDARFSDPSLFLGVFGAPRPQHLLQILFWSNRSLFPSQAHLLLAIPGVYFLIRDKTLSRAAWWALGCVLLPYALFICCFNGWNGGDCFGPRYFMPAVVVLVCLSVPVYQRWKAAYVLCVVESFVLMVVVTAVDPMFGYTADVDSPVLDYALHNFVHGNLALNQHAMFPSATNQWTSGNVGWAVGLPGVWSLVPLVLAQLAIAAALVWACRRKPSARLDALA